MPVSKNEVIARCAEVISAKKQTLLQALELLEDSLLTETKSSAGDKHETGRARVQEEQRKLLGMLNEFLEMEKTVRQLEKSASESFQQSKLVSTDKGLFFLGLSLGRVEVKGATVFVISSVSPLGAELSKRRPGEIFGFRDVNYKVLDIW